MPTNGLSGGTELSSLQADDLAGEIAEILRTLHLEAIADADIHQPGAVEDDARAEIGGCLGPLRQGLEDHLDVAEAAIAQFGAGHRGRRAAAVAPADIGEIKHAIWHEVGVQADIEQAGLTARPDQGHARQCPAAPAGRWRKAAAGRVAR